MFNKINVLINEEKNYNQELMKYQMKYRMILKMKKSY